MPAGEEVHGAGPDPARIVHENETIIQGQGPDLEEPHHAAGDPPRPAGVTQLDEFSRALVEIGLIDAAELESFAADSAEGVLGLSRALVKAGKLTAYQAAAVYQKKSRGLLIGNYLILDKLGQGGMGVVFKARHRRLGRVGALKILPPSFARDRSAVLRFRREVEAAGLLKHPNLVAALDADEDRGVHFLVMDYVEGRDLDRVVRNRGPMQVNQVVDCLIQAARGLEAAHAQGIVHRDIKPGNLMLDNAGTVRVLDLGLARIVDAANPFNKTARGRLTESGMYMGTVDYMAPEQAEDSHRVDHRADIYSLGCTLYFLLTGQEPFLGGTVLTRLMAHMEHPAPSLRIARPDIPPALDAVYLKMMAKRPADRPASMTEVIALLEASKTAPDFNKEIGAAAPKSKPELKVFNEQPLKRAGAPKTKPDPSVFALSRETGSLLSSHELNLEDLVMDVRPEPSPTPLPPVPKPAPAKSRLTKDLPEEKLPPKLPRIVHHRDRSRRAPVLAGLGVIAVLALGVVGYTRMRPRSPESSKPAPERASGPGSTEDPNALNQASWDVVRRPDATESAYRLALRQAEAACRLSPDNGLLLTTLGVARYRGGKYVDAVATLTLSDQLNSRSPDGSTPVDLAFLALAQYRLGHIETARGTLARLEEAMKRPRWANDAESQGFRRETDTIERGPIPRPSQPDTPAQNDASVLFVDDYSNPPTYSGWSATTPEQLAKDPNFRWGRRDGIYFFEASLNNCTWIKTLPGGPYSDFSYEVVGRITGDKRASKGSIIILAVREGRGFQVRIDGTGALFIEPSCTTDPTQQRGPWLGPFFHKAIKLGAAEFNKVRLQVTRRQVEIFVNSERVGPTLTFDWDINPASVGMGFDCRNPLVRAEYDRVEIKALPKSPTDSSSGGGDPQQIVRVTNGGGMVLPDGTRVFQASNLKVVEKSRGNAFPQTNMDDFPAGLWSCHRHLLWGGPRLHDTLSLEIPVEVDGQYRVFGRFTRAPDFGRVKLELDGKALNDDKSIDLYSPIVTPTGSLPLGVVSIANGKTLLKVTIASKNHLASKSNCGLAEIRFVPVR
jgi:serine/threonine protein kinase